MRAMDMRRIGKGGMRDDRSECRCATSGRSRVGTEVARRTEIKSKIRSKSRGPVRLPRRGDEVERKKRGKQGTQEENPGNRGTLSQGACVPRGTQGTEVRRSVKIGGGLGGLGGLATILGKFARFKTATRPPGGGLGAGRIGDGAHRWKQTNLPLNVTCQGTTGMTNRRHT
jgi:hypothetical protein